MFRKAQQSVAHQSTLPGGFLGNRDLRSLQDIINSEKDFIKSNARSSQDFHRTAEAIKGWASSEGEDLQDILGKLSLLFDHYTTSQTRFNAHLSTIRQHFKSIRTREESLAELRARKRSLGNKIENVEKKLQKMNPENKELMKTTSLLKELRSDMENLRVELQNEEAAIGDFKRRTAKEAMGIKCAGLQELSEKISIVAEVGKLMIEEIPLEQTQPGMPRADYLGAMKTDQLLQDATRSVADVGFVPGNSGMSRHDHSYMRPSEMNDSGQDYSTDLGQDQLQYTDANYWTEQPSADYQLQDVGDDSQTTTPIYAKHSVLSRDRSDSGAPSIPPPQPSMSHDSATDEWKRSHSLGAHDGETAASVTPIADQFASRSPDDQQVGGVGLRVVGNSSSDSLNEDVPASVAIPPSNTHPSVPDSFDTAPRISTPPAHDHSAQYDPSPPVQQPTQMPPTPSVTNTADDDEIYFQSVGSTRAAQQALRRPLSPGMSSRQPQTLSSSLGSPNSYEPQAEGRKMTAAAFRKGFGRAPSAQHMGTVSSTSLNRPGSAAGDLSVGTHDEDASNTAPLSIRKRVSAVPGQTNDSEAVDSPAPPYYDPRQQSIYGGLAGHDGGEDMSAYGQFAPPQQPWGSRPNSRPSSAGGWRTPSSHVG